jgi:hypothetical protein
MGSVTDCAAELIQLMGRFKLDEWVLPILDSPTAPDLLTQVAAALASTPARPVESPAR